MNVTATRGRAPVIELPELLREGVQQAQYRGKPVLVSLTERAIAANSIECFARARFLTRDRFFWAQPGEDFALVGIGAAQVISTVGASRFRQAAIARQELLAGALVEGPRGLPGVGPLFLGSFAFDPQRPKTPLWEGFSDGQMVLPRLLLTQHHGEAWLTYNLLVNNHTDPDTEAVSLAALYDELFAEPYRQPDIRNTSVAIQELCPVDEWKAEVAYTAQAIAEGKLAKAVLARAVRLQAAHAFDSAAALRKLAVEYPDCYLFAVAYDDQCFLGATPERLVRLENGKLQTMSLAGSIRRGSTLQEDRQLGEALLNSAKDREEHTVVVQALVEVLRETCDDVNVEVTPHLLKLGNVQHLCTLITGKLADDWTLLDLVECLHPTPAVGGRPRETALKLIREHEGLDRGRYAGPVGWLDGTGDGEFAVALRSALIRGTEATLFTGCGIVADSDPEREYAESCLKLKPMLSALTDQ